MPHLRTIISALVTTLILGVGCARIVIDECNLKLNDQCMDDLATLSVETTEDGSIVFMLNVADPTTTVVAQAEGEHGVEVSWDTSNPTESWTYLSVQDWLVNLDLPDGFVAKTSKLTIYDDDGETRWVYHNIDETYSPDFSVQGNGTGTLYWYDIYGKFVNWVASYVPVTNESPRTVICYDEQSFEDGDCELQVEVILDWQTMLPAEIKYTSTDYPKGLFYTLPSPPAPN